MRIIPSIASAGMLNIESTLKKLGEAGTLHIDIEDGNFIPNITFGMKTVKEISKATKLSLNAHLMVTNPLAYIKPLAECGVKEAAFHLSRRRFPQAKLFGLTTGEQVMRINTSLGYVPVTFAKLTDDEEFWAGCKSCVNYDILQRTNMTKCLCTGMIYDPEVVARQQAAAKKVAKGRSLPLFKHLRHVVGSTLAVCGLPVSRSAMKHTANL